MVECKEAQVANAQVAVGISEEKVLVELAVLGVVLEGVGESAQGSEVSGWYFSLFGGIGVGFNGALGALREVFKSTMMG